MVIGFLLDDLFDGFGGEDDTVEERLDGGDGEMVLGGGDLGGRCGEWGGGDGGGVG